MFIDTHAHLYNEKFEGKLKEVLTFCKQQKVDKIICSAADIASAYQAVMLADKFDNIYATIGVHPQDCVNFSEKDLKTLEALAKNEKVVGIGEIGLEYLDGCPDKEIQKTAFLNQIKLAYKLQLPIVIHCREAVGDCLKLLKENQKFLNFGGTFHCFSESIESANEVLKLGLHISIGGVVTFKNGKRLQEVAPAIPLDRLLLETDCPYLAPEPYRGTLNHPGNIPIIAQKIATLKGLSLQEIETATTQNARRLFKI